MWVKAEVWLRRQFQKRCVWVVTMETQGWRFEISNTIIFGLAGSVWMKHPCNGKTLADAPKLVSVWTAPKLDTKNITEEQKYKRILMSTLSSMSVNSFPLKYSYQQRLKLESLGPKLLVQLGKKCKSTWTLLVLLYLLRYLESLSTLGVFPSNSFVCLIFFLS